MNVPFWDPKREYLKYKDEIDLAIKDVLESGNYIMPYGGYVEKFEKQFAEFVGAKHAIMTGAGTHALYLSYRALGIGPGDEVIVPSHTFIATIDQIVAVGAKPVLADIGDDGLISPEAIKNLITEKTKGIVPVHLEGKICDIDKITKIRNEFTFSRNQTIWIIIDSAQALGSKWESSELRRTGIWKTNQGVLSCYSLFPAKILGCVGNAGMITTNDNELADRLRMMRCCSNIGKNPDLNAEWGVNMEPDNIQASILNAKMKYLPEKLSRREGIAKMYDEGLKDLPITLALKQEGRVYQDYVIRVPERKQELCQFLLLNGVGILGHNLIPNHHYKILEEWKLPNTDKYIAEQIRIPCNPELTDEEVTYVIETIKRFYR